MMMSVALINLQRYFVTQFLFHFLSKKKVVYGPVKKTVFVDHHFPSTPKRNPGNGPACYCFDEYYLTEKNVFDAQIRTKNVKVKTVKKYFFVKREVIKYLKNGKKIGQIRYLFLGIRISFTTDKRK